MTRVRNFPVYTKITLDPEAVPDGYYESALQCIECGTLWPAIKEFSPTICCRAYAGKVPRAPDMSWKNAVKALLEFRFEQWYDKYNDGMTDNELIIQGMKEELNDEDIVQKNN